MNADNSIEKYSNHSVSHPSEYSNPMLLVVEQVYNVVVISIVTIATLEEGASFRRLVQILRAVTTDI
jgi:hypothetical protein